MYCQDAETWKEHLGAEGGLVRFLESGKVLPIAEWISPEEVKMHNRKFKAAGYTGPFNWYKARMLLDPPKEVVELTEEEMKVKVPTLLITTNNDIIVIKDIQVQGTKAAAEDLRVESLDTGH